MSRYTKGQFDDLYEQLKQFYTRISSGDIDLATVTRLAVFAMECVQSGHEFTKLKGSAKKDLVLAVITALVSDLLEDLGSDFSKSTRKAILRYLEALPTVIDATVSFAHIYELDKMTKKACNGCFRK